MSSHPVDIYLDGRRMGGASFAEGRIYSDTVSRSSTSTEPFVLMKDCDHEAIATAWAYLDWGRERWPIQVCLTCRAIVRGRNPHDAGHSGDSFEFTVEDVIAERWRKQWPADGRPRGKPPANIEWPEGV